MIRNVSNGFGNVSVSLLLNEFSKESTDLFYSRESTDRIFLKKIAGNGRVNLQSCNLVPPDNSQNFKLGRKNQMKKKINKKIIMPKK